MKNLEGDAPLSNARILVSLTVVCTARHLIKCKLQKLYGKICTPSNTKTAGSRDSYIVNGLINFMEKGRGLFKVRIRFEGK